MPKRLTRHLIDGVPEEHYCERPARAAIHPFSVIEHPGGDRVGAAVVLYEVVGEVIAKVIANPREDKGGASCSPSSLYPERRRNLTTHASYVVLAPAGTSRAVDVARIVFPRSYGPRRV